MNAPVTTGAFADRLPPRTPTLRELAERLIVAGDAFNAAVINAPDDEFIAVDGAFIAARAAFEGALEAQTGISRELWDRLGGVL